ncbi:MAG: hypothetical protein IH586_13240, partial [Anaerolineaceae bacterium]|nr:hypothetical protein [Anaerolineaceae bacterium]
TAAALAVQYSCSPREVGHNHLQVLQALLMDDDAYLPGFTRPVAELSRSASLTVTRGNAQPLRSGIDRMIGAADNGWWASPNDMALYTFDTAKAISQIRLVFDSNQADTKRMPCWYPKEGTDVDMPPMLPRTFAIEIQDNTGTWQRVQQVEENASRLVKLSLSTEAGAVRFVPLRTWGAEQAHIMGFEIS